MSTLLSRETVYRGYLQVNKITLEGPDGPYCREVVERGHSVSVLCYDLSRQSVLLTEQFRPGAYPQPGLVLECIAGMIDPGEDAESAIRREAKEEAGLTLLTLARLGTFSLSPGILTETTTLFLATADFSSLDLEVCHGAAGEHEYIQLHEVPFTTFFRHISGDVPCPITLRVAGDALQHRLSSLPPRS